MTHPISFDSPVSSRSGKQMPFSRVLAQHLPTAWNTQVPSHQLASASVDWLPSTGGAAIAAVRQTLGGQFHHSARTHCLGALYGCHRALDLLVLRHFALSERVNYLTGSLYPYSLPASEAW